MRRTYQARVIVEPFDLEDPALSERFFNAPLSVYPAVIDDLHELELITEADTEEDAVRTMERFLHELQPHLRALRFEHELVTLSEIAERFDVTHEAARLWAQGTRSRGFPKHYQAAGTVQLWSWHEVYLWGLTRRQPIDEVHEDMPLSPGITACANARMAGAAENNGNWVPGHVAFTVGPATVHTTVRAIAIEGHHVSELFRSYHGRIPEDA